MIPDCNHDVSLIDHFPTRIEVDRNNIHLCIRNDTLLEYNSILLVSVSSWHSSSALNSSEKVSPLFPAISVHHTYRMLPQSNSMTGGRTF